MLCRKKNGNLIGSKARIIGRWREYFMKQSCTRNNSNNNAEEKEETEIDASTYVVLHLQRTDAGQYIYTLIHQRDIIKGNLKNKKDLGGRKTSEEWSIVIICPLHKNGSKWDERKLGA